PRRRAPEDPVRGRVGRPGDTRGDGGQAPRGRGRRADVARCPRRRDSVVGPRRLVDAGGPDFTARGPDGATVAPLQAGAESTLTPPATGRARVTTRGTHQ